MKFILDHDITVTLEENQKNQFADIYITFKKNSIISLDDDFSTMSQKNILENIKYIISLSLKIISKNIVKNFKTETYKINKKEGGKMSIGYPNISDNIFAQFQILSEYVSEDENNHAYQKYFDKHNNYPDLTKWNEPQILNENNIQIKVYE